LPIAANYCQFAAICRILPQFDAKCRNLPQLIAKRLRGFFELNPRAPFYCGWKKKLDQNGGQQFHWPHLHPTKQLFLVSSWLRQVVGVPLGPTNTNGYNLPKVHGITKMQEYMMLFGSGINFYGGPGESAHKQFIKIPWQRTQQRVSEFAHQIALQYYNMFVSGYAAHNCQMKSHLYKQSGNSDTDLDTTEPKGYIFIEMSGSLISEWLVFC
jgi:hypothetical protein